MPQTSHEGIARRLEIARKIADIYGNAQTTPSHWYALDVGWLQAENARLQALLERRTKALEAVVNHAAEQSEMMECCATVVRQARAALEQQP